MSIDERAFQEVLKSYRLDLGERLNAASDSMLRPIFEAYEASKASKPEPTPLPEERLAIEAIQNAIVGGLAHQVARHESSEYARRALSALLEKFELRRKP
jgi:hypothetical protein